MNAASGVSPAYSGRVLRNEPLSRHTSWHVGGPADFYFEPRDTQDLETFLHLLPQNIPLTWIGLGSNLLVRDGGLRGVVIATQTALNRMERLSETLVSCEAGIPCARLAKQCVQWGLGPAEFFAGIPGTVGGALAMNAGAFGGETWNHVVSVDTIDHHGKRHARDRAEYTVGYRSVEPPVAGEWFLGARLMFERRPQVHAGDIKALLERRKATQPIGEWSGGSTFVNPPGHHAAKLIEAAGLKGFRIGGASVSTKHANFIVNEGTATAADIEDLIHHVQATVEQAHGVALQTEVRIIGDPA